MSLEEADEIVFTSLRRAGVPLPKSVKSVTALTPELLVALVVHTVRAIADDALASDVTDKLPAYMAARHRLCSTIATAVRELGYAGEMGYNQLLYPNERDTRRLLSWLAGKLPRAEEEGGAGAGGAGGGAGAATGPAAVRAALFRHMKPWVRDGAPTAPRSTAPVSGHHRLITTVPPGVAAGAHSATLRAAATFIKDAWPEAAAAATSPSTTAAAAALASSSYATAFHPRVQAAALAAAATGTASSGSGGSGGGVTSLPACVAVMSVAGDVEAVVAEVPCAATPAPLQHSYRRWMTSTCGGRPLSATYPGTVLDVYASPFTRAAAFAIPPPSRAGPMALGGAAGVTGGDTTKTEEEIAAEREAELAAMNSQLESVTEEIGRLADQFRLLTTSLPSLRTALKDATDRKVVVEQRYLVRKACLDMLPEAAANITRLTSEVAAGADRLIALAEEWETHRVPLVGEVHRLLSLKAEQDGTVASLQGKIDGVRAAMAALASDMASKEEAAAKMAAEWQRLKEVVPTLVDPSAAGTGAEGEVATRPVYTRRIMDIIRQIRKQKAEIGRIVKDVRTVQQEIVVVSDKLTRTALVTTERMEKAAAENAKEAAYRQALGQLLRLQELFNHLITAVVQLGHMENDIRQLDNRAEQLSARNDARNMDQLMADLAQIRSDNAALEAAVAAAGGAGLAR